MSYHFTKVINDSFENAITRTTEELKNEGFGVLTEIDVKETLKKKIDVEFRKYRILGACNPTFAYKALQEEDKIGVMLPCNVILQEKQDGVVEISAVDPVSSMMGIKNSGLEKIAAEVQQKLKNVINKI